MQAQTITNNNNGQKNSQNNLYKDYYKSTNIINKSTEMLTQLNTTNDNNPYKCQHKSIQRLTSEKISIRNNQLTKNQYE